MMSEDIDILSNCDKENLIIMVEELEEQNDKLQQENKALREKLEMAKNALEYYREFNGPLRYSVARRALKELDAK